MGWNIVSVYRRLLELETGAVIKDWGGKIPIALAFPNSYHLGMSNLGFQAVYGLLNDLRDVVCERFFLPEPALAAEYARTGTRLLSVESQRPLSDFELAAFSISHENDYPSVLRILRMSGLEVRRPDRTEVDPPILIGGVTARSNPEPLADFIDLALLGDGEVILPLFLRAWREIRSGPLPKTDRMLHLARTAPGAYSPAHYETALAPEGRLMHFPREGSDAPERVRVVRADRLPDPALATRILTPKTEFAGVRLVEIGRGCPRGCRFCLAGYVYRPPRFASVDAVMKALGPAGEKERVGLVSPAAADHPQLEEMVKQLTAMGRQVTVSSLHLESLTPNLVEALALGKMKSVALAPEAGGQRLRAVVNKGLTEKKIIEGVELLAAAGVKRLKLYYMLGLPTEERDDVRAIVELTMKIRGRIMEQAASRRLMPEITLTLSSFVPKPHTPFQAWAMQDARELKNRAREVRNGLAGVKGLKVHFDQPRWSYIQTVLSRGDRRAGELVDALDLFSGDTSRAFKELSFDPEIFIRDQGEGPWPWSFIDHGVKDDYLAGELVKAGEGRFTKPCRPAQCRSCGVCSDRAQSPDQDPT